MSSVLPSYTTRASQMVDCWQHRGCPFTPQKAKGASRGLREMARGRAGITSVFRVHPLHMRYKIHTQLILSPPPRPTHCRNRISQRHVASLAVLCFAAFSILINGVVLTCASRFWTGAFIVALCPLLPVVAGDLRSLFFFFFPVLLLAYASFVVFGFPWDLSAELSRAVFFGILAVTSIWRAWRLDGGRRR